MLVSSPFFLISLLWSATSSNALVGPTTPGPNETYNARSSCKIAWTPDKSGVWNNMTIALMSGSNSNMSLVTKVAEDLDGTNASLTPYSWTCPEVTPYSAIYFYQFTNGNSTASSAWTTRFTIASPAGDSEPPENVVQPDGDKVAWGIGQLKEARLSTNSSVSLDTSTIPSQPLAEHNQAPFVASLLTPTLPTATVTVEVHDPDESSNSKHRHLKHEKTRSGVSKPSQSPRHSTSQKAGHSSDSEAPWSGLVEASSNGESNGVLRLRTVTMLDSLSLLIAICHIVVALMAIF